MDRCYFCHDAPCIAACPTDIDIPLCIRQIATGKKVAIMGAGPADLACAHRLALLGHEVIVMDPRPMSGGLNEYGIATYKTVDDFAQAEVDWLLQIGGIYVRYGATLRDTVALEGL